MRLSCLLGGALFALSVAGIKVSNNARCGADGKDATCLGSQWGNCCSQYSYCGSSDAYCGSGCQNRFGSCRNVAPIQSPSVARPPTPSRSSAPSSPSPQPLSKNARCGAGFGGQSCRGSKWGDCCSQYSYCGSTSDYCRADSCQAGYGKCSSGPSSAPGSSISASRSSIAPSSSSMSLITSSSFSAPSAVSCGPRASYCADVPLESTASCLSLITQSRLRVATCEQTGAVVTQIVTSRPAASTSTTTIISSVTETTTVPTTAVVTSTSTYVATEGITVTVPATVTSVDSITATTTTTVTSPAQSQESVCTRSPVRLVRDINRRTGFRLPEICSCFLTSTKESAASTATATTVLPVDQVVVTATSFVTATTSVVQTIQQTEAALASSAITVIDLVTVTVTEPATSVVSTATATATSYASHCENLRQLPGRPSISNGGVVVLSITRDITTAKFCCENCASNRECVYYELLSGGKICKTYATKRTVGTPVNACRSGKCPEGVQHYDTTIPEAGSVFYVGTCLAAAPGGS